MKMWICTDSDKTPLIESFAADMFNNYIILKKYFYRIYNIKFFVKVYIEKLIKTE